MKKKTPLRIKVIAITIYTVIALLIVFLIILFIRWIT